MKKLTLTAISAVMAASMVAVPVLAEEAAPTGTVMNYGFSINADDTAYYVDYNVLGDAEGKAALSANVNITEGEDSIDIPLNDILVADDSAMYVNASTAANVYEQLTGASDITDLFAYLGITSEWVSFPMPAIDKIICPTPDASQEQAPAVDINEIASNFMPILMNFLPTTDENGNTIITVTRDQLLTAAQQLDTAIAATGAQISVPSADITGSLSGLDIKPALEAYINAVAEGYAQAVPETSVEDAAAMIGQLIDSVVEEFISSLDVSLNGVSIDPEQFSSASVYDALSEAIGDTDFTLTITFGSTEASAALTIGEQTMVLAGGLGENGIEVTLGDGTNVYYTGTVEMTEEGAALVVADAQANELLRAGLTMEDGSYVLAANAAGNELGSITATPTETGLDLTVASQLMEDVLFLSCQSTEEDGFTGSLSFGDLFLYANCNADLGDTEGSGNVYFSASVDGSDVSFGAYLDYAPSDATVEIPEACDGLNVVTAVSKMLFEQMAAAEEATPET